MDFLERLDALMDAKGWNKRTLAQSSGVPYTTIVGLYKKGYDNTKLTTLRGLASALGVSVDYLIGGPETKNAPGISPEAMKVAVDYDGLPGWGQRWVRNLIRDVQDTVAELAKPVEDDVPEPEPEQRTVPLFQAFAAGPAEPDMGSAPEKYVVDADSPADFAITVNGTSMEPYLPDQSVQLGVFRTPQAGEVGAFVLDGEYLVKQYFRDMLGNVYLLSLNRAEEDKDVTLWAANAEFRQLTVLGVILMDKAPPLPQI